MRRLRPFSIYSLTVAACFIASNCNRRGTCGDYCGTLVVVSANMVTSLLPAVSVNNTEDGVAGQVFLKLADVGLSGNTVGDADFVPQLAQRWEWDDPKTLVLHLDPRARWQDGPSVTAYDVAFTFNAYTDPAVGSNARSALQRIASVTPRDSLTVVFRFRQHYLQMFYDAVYQMRILPQHLLAQVPRNEWHTAAFGSAPVGDGPYRFAALKVGETVELVADSTFFLGRPHIRRLIVRMAATLQPAVLQVIADQADAIEILGPPANVALAQKAPQLALVPYKGTQYGFALFNLRANGDSTKPHPIFGDRDVRRALTMALDREQNLTSVFGPYAKVPPGPMPQWWSIWDSTSHPLSYDSAAAARLLSARGWRPGADGIREKDGRRLSFDVMSLSSPIRLRFAQLMQQQFKSVGVEIQITTVDQATLATRDAAGQFDVAMLAYSSDPTPESALPQLWTPKGNGDVGRYSSPTFERLLGEATEATTPAEQARLWRGALDVLTSDAPGIWLYAPDNVAAIHKRVTNVQIRPDSWLALLRTWRIPADQMIDRDRVGR
jgi:peptide/nickel transport system substrate-binding protein